MHSYLTFFISLIISFSITFFLIPKFIQKFKEENLVVRDYYKINKTLVPTMGGLPILMGVLSSLIILQIIFPLVEELLIFYFVIVISAVFGLVDDLINIGRKIKIIAPFFLAFPIALLNIDTSLSLIFIEIELGILFSYIIAPLYVMVVSNLINMHSGFNGVSGGVTTILIVFSAIAAFIKFNYTGLIYIAPILGAMIAFMYFNKYPSRIFLGNIGTLMIGAALGGFIIFLNLEIFGVIILIPHIINFLMFVYWKLRGYPHIKFGKVDKNGILHVPNNLTVKWFLPYYFPMTEKKAILFCYLFSIMSGIAGILYILPR
ncbi:MAG: phospho-N-acetylmuramoyl-pentapeptide-transferase [Candidatus Methanofastidiosum methylothiophilum]|jgi:UDP-N-acetylglucosamine--dolichyl-phosphate N-acetylglucosaminephosphotransferase|uniref:Phospho-N-acetylmuramoyl-pentapeptide-transferase n=1 Tax=Candidatus Methanofastidiosum methylothiophilum TaxID=1705564 RepID=A0A150JCF9_9EURY|nr:MAG: phospho-N-acetylmuramoyl-pentapeptide-transferase [Candidatus Methanofastidiosum methylthiophilus]MBP6932516.1 UDP-N-acetylglucosamine-1-phosphate transferase [Methanofastidiosum sp.]OQC51447.1 MAG: phospho-N-acetylmuramoyl-pentapeptide-transferase [Euryarchaeota archaeon ADurb.Bin023]KYC55906.1 MAG: phospho-N-acetylmuramoyl-pentapeptide-transferase [Candidatus Methanofastidiosum methylthiophilus]KYC58578.1 MAG: phospho-N-acetylmuramoyl-pentapeptide-transferase [Candidatus Methanofastid